MFHVYLNTFEIEISHLFLIIFSNNKCAVTKNIALKGINLSKALTCMNIFLYKQIVFFCQGDRYLWPHCCMNNLYI